MKSDDRMFGGKKMIVKSWKFTGFKSTFQNGLQKIHPNVQDQNTSGSTHNMVKHQQEKASGSQSICEAT